MNTSKEIGLRTTTYLPFEKTLGFGFTKKYITNECKPYAAVSVDNILAAVKETGSASGITIDFWEEVKQQISSL